MKLRDVIEVILYVQGMQEAVEFYRDKLGLEVSFPVQEDYSQEFWVVFNTGSCQLCLHGGAEGRARVDGAKVVFGVEEIHEARRQLLARGVELSEVFSPAPGVRVCNGRDPAGNPFSIEERD